MDNVVGHKSTKTIYTKKYFLFTMEMLIITLNRIFETEGHELRCTKISDDNYPINQVGDTDISNLL